MEEQKSYARAFRNFVKKHDCKSSTWFGSTSLEDCEEHEDIVQMITLPLEFVASKLSAKISISVETAGTEGPHYIVACNRLVVEDERPSPTEFQWPSNDEFDDWCAQKMERWRKDLAIGKLLQTV